MKIWVFHHGKIWEDDDSDVHFSLAMLDAYRHIERGEKSNYGEKKVQVDGKPMAVPFCEMTWDMAGRWSRYGRTAMEYHGNRWK